MISDLSPNLLEEILSKVPISCLGAVRRTCKRWNALSKTRIVCNAEATDHEFVGFMMKDFRVCSLRFNLRGILNEEGEAFVGPSIKEIGGNFPKEVEISKIFHCGGLLLCVARDKTRLVVWNPYLGQIRWIEPRNNNFHRLDRYALGYDEKMNYKILRFLDNDLDNNNILFGYEIFDISSSSWRVLDISPDWDTDFYQRGVSLKGNAYFFAKPKIEVLEGDSVEDPKSFLFCFDFTSERFGPSLPLPFDLYSSDIGTLSSIRDEKLAALFQGLDTAEVEIWVTTEIEPNAVSWIPFLKIDIRPFTASVFRFNPGGASFFLDEKKKIAVVFDSTDGGEEGWSDSLRNQAAYIIGERGYLKRLDLGPRQYLSPPMVGLGEFYPLVCSYAPSLAQINQATT